ncbi:MAG: hypothetical protein JWM34_5026 [Ilumatobacteraceae bacterium]|nr:hypothetical protein [Ilumatobacteraceae bacterium]
MQVVFFRAHERKRICAWTAHIGKRRVPGAVMGYGNGLPHDLTQFVIECAGGYRLGFWGLLAQGATYKSTGQRRTKPGRAVIVQHRAELNASEQFAGLHTSAWANGEITPVTVALHAALAQWHALGQDEAMVFEWPDPSGRVVPLDAADRRLALTH